MGELQPEALVILSRTRGRPRQLPASTPLMARVPDDVYDQLCRMALRHQMPVGALVRELLTVVIRPGDRFL